ncbi:MAG TPA: hypothetical protein VFJ43_00295 [Bacteroidia bacterium]|nr:hypothetical protein [Bacteroidia bacterium]
MNRTATLIASAITFILATSFIFKGDDTSSIEGKQYKISIMEAKKGGKSGTAEEDVCSFKGSKFHCKFFGKNAGADAIPIDLDKDSTYVDEAGNEEMLYVEFSGEMSNKLEETVKVSGTIDGYGIEGNVELSKKGKLKKHWDFVGTEKDKKKK